MNTSTWIGIIVVIVLAVGGYVVFQKPAEAPTTGTEQTQTNTTATQTSTTTGSSQTTTGSGVSVGVTGSVSVGKTVTVTYTDSGFSPKSVTVKQGDRVKWVNQSSEKMWVATDAHPSHTDYDGTSRSEHCATGYTGAVPFDECKADGAGATYTFTFTETGSWDYHNHFAANKVGTVVVTK